MTAGGSFEEALARGLADGQLAKALRPFQRLGTAGEARALVGALDRMVPEVGDVLHGPLGVVTSLYQWAEDDAVVAVLREGFPRLLALHDRTLAALRSAEGRRARRFAGDLACGLKIFAMWPSAGGAEALRRVVEGAREPGLRDDGLWSLIFDVYGKRDHPAGRELVERLRAPLLVDGFAAVAFLDLVNALCREGRLAAHPHATPEGVAWLEAKLRDTEHASHAHSAAAALPFVAPADRERLLAVGRTHPDVDVRMETAWADVHAGGTAGLFVLVGLCRDPHASTRAQAYLKELGRSDAVPPEARERDFRAMAEMSSWLQHPNEFRAPPDELVLFDTRELDWPPTRDRRRVWLFRYTYEKAWGREGRRETGLGMVGSTTFALAGKATTDLSAEDAYALYCCWELQARKDPRAPAERTVAEGRKLLGLDG